MTAASNDQAAADRPNGTWRFVLVLVVILNVLGALFSSWVIIQTPLRPERMVGAAFLLVCLVSLVAAVYLYRRRSGGYGVALAIAFVLISVVPPLVILFVSTRQLGDPMARRLMLNSRITEGRLPPAVRTSFGLPSPQPLAVLGADGMTVFIRPSFGFIDYDVDLAPGGLALPERPTARLMVRPKTGAPREYRFHVPSEALRATLAAFDARARTWRGAEGMTLDGTTILVERVAADRVISIETNSPSESSPSNPAAQLGTDLLALMLAYGPTGMIPRSYDWHVGQPGPGSRCFGVGLNTAIPAGVRSGGKDCFERNTDAKGGPPS